MDDGTANTICLVLKDEDGDIRLDRYLALQLAGYDLSRSRLKSLILEGRVQIDGRVVKDPAMKSKAGMSVTVHIPEPETAVPEPEDIPLSVIYEDDSLLVIDKPAGLVVHPGAGNKTGTLVNGLLHYCGDTLSGIGGVKRPGIVHRLDKDTSGLLVVAKNDKAHKGLSAQLSDRTLSRIYMALVWGVPPRKKGEIDMPVGRHRVHRQKMAVVQRGGKPAKTFFRTEACFGETGAVLSCQLESGRTHQIRVHMAETGHPLVGDPLYGLQDNAGRSRLKKGGYPSDAIDFIMGFPRQALHAKEISFRHPENDEEMTFYSDIPDDIQKLISFFKQ